MNTETSNRLNIQLSTPLLAKRLGEEIVAKAQQGYGVEGLADALAQITEDRDALLEFHAQLQGLTLRDDWGYDEPSDLEAIRAARKDPVAGYKLYLSEREIAQKIYGGYLGRAAGCVLGKPLEMDYDIDDIREYLEGANAYPLDDFVPAQSRSEKILRRDCVPSMRGYVRYAQEDDDMNYMCLAVKLLEKHGPNFSTLDVGLNWIGSMPFMWTWGPEQVVYLNLATAVGEHDTDKSLIDVEAVAGYFNPGVEWIGAQIRTDVFGYVSPANLELAAEFAWRDAYLSHRKNGIYGPMWVSAMCAAAFTQLDIETIIRAGLSQIPAGSRFYEAVNNVITWYHEDQDWRKTGYRIREHYGEYGMVGVINNACCVAAALLYGWGDGSASPAQIYEDTITIAVQLGYDTDCNGATAGSIIGLMLGADHLPEKWIAPLQDTLQSTVSGFGQVTFSELSRRTYELSRAIRWATASASE